MNFLELKIPPLILVVIFGAFMWFLFLYTPIISFPYDLHLYVAAIIFLIALLFILAGVLSFRTHKTTVNPTTPQVTSALVTSGVYQLSRNPMYLGFLFFLLAWVSYLASAMTLLGPVFFVLYMNTFQIKPEEKMLKSLFGDEFNKYKKSVRRWI